MERVVGIDLAGSEKRETGFCVLEGANCFTKILHTDKEIVSEVEKVKPAVIAIDAPLSLPKGRKGINDKTGPHFRKCDLELKKMKIKFFPITLGPMRKLTERGMKLKKMLEKMGYKVIETYPGAAQDIWKIPRKQKGTEKLRRGLRKLGIRGIKKDATGDELDAITCAVVARDYLKGKFIEIGDKKEGTMILPLP